jgi:DNA-binding CsgD family transcriptional regulator
LKLIAESNSTPQIADKLFIAHSTVETHRRNLIDKLGVVNSKELIRYAIENGYLN